MSTMREALVSILLLVAAADCSELGKDVNYYKDYLRARSDELPEGPAMADRLYFYRTPLQLYPGLLPVLEQEYRKRTGNVFKNHMLNKDAWLEEMVPEKRSSKAALSAMLQGKHAFHTRACPDCLAVCNDKIIVCNFAKGMKGIIAHTANREQVEIE